MDIIPVTINEVRNPNIIHKTMNNIAIIISIPDIVLNIKQALVEKTCNYCEYHYN